MSIAEKLREIGAGPGSIIEIGYRSDGIDKAIADCLNKENEGEVWKGGDCSEEKVTAMLGWLLEITAIGETAVLAFPLVGDSFDGSNRYQPAKWERDGSSEGIFYGCSMLQKVGELRNGTIVWTQPDLVNIYTRLQTE